ncbi:MAG: phosphate acyltransferase PlsX [Nitrospinae bacterium]|nr:phosphate acyltransferase PlsX [Nitrospinota bacterium]
MKIAVDAMGGDNAPEVVVDGVIQYLQENQGQIILFGQQDLLFPLLEKKGAKDLPIEVRHSSESVDMNEAPSTALRRKKDSSIRKAIESVASGEAGAVVSAGNTGAVLAISTVILKPMQCVDRPAISILLPTAKGHSILLDAGANVDCKSSQLFQFAIMGHVYAKYVLKKENPKVGLLSIGEEDSKGNEISKEAFKMLKKTDINFIGNVEGKEVYRGNADVIVCDGFTGNIALKISESLAEMIGNSIKDLFMTNWRTKLAFKLVEPYFRAFKKSVDYNEVGGAPLLGINGTCIICHGSSKAKAIKNAIQLAEEFIKNEVNAHIREGIEKNLAHAYAGARKGRFWQQLKETIHFGSGAEKTEPES